MTCRRAEEATIRRAAGLRSRCALTDRPGVTAEVDVDPVARCGRAGRRERERDGGVREREKEGSAAYIDHRDIVIGHRVDAFEIARSVNA